MTGLPALLGGLGLVAVAFGLLSALLAIFQPITDPSWIVGNLAIGVILLSAALFAGFDSVRQRLQSGEARRVGKYGTSAVASTILIVAILGMLGFLAQRHPVRFDWSEAQENTLTEQSLGLLERLEADVTITAFFQRSEVPDVAALLDRYAYASERVDVDYVDPNAAPLLVEELALDPEALARGLVRVSTGDAGIVVTELTESGITNGLLRLTRSSVKKVYFVEGHNERSIADEEDGAGQARDGAARAADALRNETYRVESLALTTRAEIPEDADAVVIAGPTRPWFDHELEALRRYLARGGALLVMLDPRAQTNLYGLLEDLGVTLGDDVVVDQVQAIAGQATIPLAGRYSLEHPITRDLDRRTLFPMVRSVDGEAGGHTVIVETGESSWAERDLAGWQETGRAELDERDLAGPVPIAVAGTLPAPDADPDPAAAGAGDAGEEALAPAEARLVVYGDSDFMSNEFIEALYNRDLFLNTVNWLVGDVEQITLRPRLSRASRFELGADEFRGILYLSLFVLPEGIAVAGVVAWWLRRGRGEGVERGRS